MPCCARLQRKKGVVRCLVCFFGVCLVLLLVLVGFLGPVVALCR